MIIDTVEISNLGLWENLFLKFDKSINIIQGENGVGNAPPSKRQLCSIRRVDG